MKKTIALGIIFLLVVMSFTSISGIQINNQTIEFSGEGNILYVGGIGEGNYSRIQDAIDNASDGDTVFVYDDSSPYYEFDIIIDKSISLIGEDKNTTVIDGNTSDNCDLINVSANWVKISRLTLQNTNINGYGIRITGDNNTISDNIIQTHYVGIIIQYYAEYNTVIGNNILDNYYGICVCWYSLNTTITGNNITKNKWVGIGDSRGYTNITNNNISDNYGLGILLETVDYENIIGNNVSNNDYGICLENWNYNCTISENIVNSNNYSGIGWISGGGDNNVISENTISLNNYYGIRLDNNKGNNNLLYHNNIIGNTPQNAYDSFVNIWDDGNYGNYWSDYEERYPDAKPKFFKPWMWDTPYEIPGGNNTDTCPLVKEWPNSASKAIPRYKAVTNNNLFLLRILERFPFLQKLMQQQWLGQ